MKLQIRVDDNGVISDVKFKTFGCGSAIASSSYMTERVKGLSLEEAEKIKNSDIAEELCLPPVKLHCSSEYPPLSVLQCYLTWDAQCLRRTLSGLLSRTTDRSVLPLQTPSRPASSTYLKAQHQHTLRQHDRLHSALCHIS